MSERTRAPRPGGRVTDQRGTMPARDADARSDARGARHFTDDTRQSGTRGVSREERGEAKMPRGADLARGKGRRPEPMIGRGRTERTARAGGRRPVLDAPVDGTAALKTEAFVDRDVAGAEPLKIERAKAEPLRIERAKAEPLRIERAKAEPKAAEERAPRLRVAPPAPVSAPRAPFVASVIGVVIVGVLGILLINTKTNENSFRIADLQKQDTQLDNQQQDLDNQLVEVSSIGNLDAAARRLGLVKADNPALFTLPDGKIIGVLTPVNGKPAVTAGDAATGKTAQNAATGKTAENAATGQTGGNAGTPTTATTGGNTGTGH